MQYPYYILRKIKRAMFWFFEEEVKKIYLRHWSEIEEELQEGDTIYALKHRGIQIPSKYVEVSSIEGAILTHHGEDEMKMYIKARYQLDKGYEGCNEWYY
jgi:hypothetical protein